MVSDSPYQGGVQVMTPRTGIVAGLGAALAMPVLLAFLHPVSGFQTEVLLVQLGSIILPGASDSSLLMVGATLHLLLGALFGLLYAVCQEPISTQGLLGVGIFYGFLLWIVTSLLAGTMFGETLREVLRSWPMLVGFLFYGFCLATAAIWTSRHRLARIKLVVPKD